MNQIDLEVFKPDFSEFKEKTRAFYAGEMDKGAYKSFSGYYGSYAQRGGKTNMLRLRMPAGQVTKERMAFTAHVVKKYKIPRIHFTTCQTIQLHDLGPDDAGAIMEEALDAGIVTLGGGGDYPRNVMCSPLSGVEKDEYFVIGDNINNSEDSRSGNIGPVKADSIIGKVWFHMASAGSGMGFIDR